MLQERDFCYTQANKGGLCMYQSSTFVSVMMWYGAIIFAFGVYTGTLILEYLSNSTYENQVPTKNPIKKELREYCELMPPSLRNLFEMHPWGFMVAWILCLWVFAIPYFSLLLYIEIRCEIEILWNRYKIYRLKLKCKRILKKLTKISR